MRKYILAGLVLVGVIVGVLTLAFSSISYKDGDIEYNSKYYDSAYDAYENDDPYPLSEIENELATIVVNENNAIWIVSTDNDEFIFVKMSVKNNQYCSLGRYTVDEISNCHSSELDTEYTLGKKDILKFTVLPYSEFKHKDDKSIKLEKFDYNNQTYVFAYKIN